MAKLILSQPQIILDAMYRLELNDDDWMSRLAAAMNHFIDGGSGTLGCRFQLNLSALPSFFPASADEQIPAFIRFLRAADRASSTAPDDSQRYGRLFAGYGIGTSSVNRSGTPANELFQMEFGPAGMGDAAGFLARHPESRQFLLFTSGHPEPTAVPRGARRRWDNLHDHMSAVLDLRWRLQNDSLDERDAVWFDGSGPCVDRGPLRDANVRQRLEEAVRRHDRTRSEKTSSARIDVDRYWENVLSGEWVLVDHFDSDGRRFVMAVPVAESGRGLRALSEREREITRLVVDGLSNMEIAFELTISETSVSSHLHSIYRKLGLPGRTELVSLLAATRKSKKT